MRSTFCATSSSANKGALAAGLHPNKKEADVVSVFPSNRFMFMKFSSVVFGWMTNPQVMPLALAVRWAPAALGHARTVILWGDFHFEVDGGSNRGAYQGGEISGLFGAFFHRATAAY